jgi:hypothetical protein
MNKRKSDEDFVKATEEYKAKQSSEQKNYWPWIFGGLVIAGIIVSIYFFLTRNKKY